MKGPYVKISLEDDSRNQTVWVSYMPVHQKDLYGALDATGKAITSFIANLSRDEETQDSVSRWLSGIDLAPYVTKL